MNGSPRAWQPQPWASVSDDCFEDEDLPGLCALHEAVHRPDGTDVDLCGRVTQRAVDDPPPLYHGTRAGFRGRGGLVMPGSQVGRDNTTGADHYTDHGIAYRGAHIYLTTDWDLAAEFARRARGRGKPKVLTVRPIGAIQVDRGTTYDGEERDDVFLADAAFVLKTEVVVDEVQAG